MKFLIIGGDAAGMSAASRAKRNAPGMEVTVLEQTGDVSYSACGMPYNIADPKRAIDDLVVRSAEAFREKQQIDLLTGHRAMEIDMNRRSVHGEAMDGKSFTKTYDRLLIATGASPRLPDIPGIDLPGVLALKSLADGRKLKQYLHSHPVKHVVIIGMGYIAMEMCEALRHRSIDVSMVKPRPGLLPWMNREMAGIIEKMLLENQVTVKAGCPIQKIEKNGESLSVFCSDGQLAADMVLTAVGVKPNSELADAAGLDLGPQKAIAVDRHLRTSAPDVYAAGDCADAYHVVTGDKVWIPLALRANRAGWAVADNVAGPKETTLPGVAGTAVFKVFDLQVARTGLTVQEAEIHRFDPVEVMIKTRSRAHAHPGAVPIYVSMVGDRKSGRLLGVQMVGREGVAHRINAPAVALHAGLSVSDFLQADLAYAPPFGPVWDPVLTAANQLIKAM